MDKGSVVRCIIRDLNEYGGTLKRSIMRTVAEGL